MSSFFFIIRSFALAMFVVFVLQIEVGKQSLEQHIIKWEKQNFSMNFLRIKSTEIGASFKAWEKKATPTKKIKESIKRTLSKVKEKMP